MLNFFLKCQVRSFESYQMTVATKLKYLLEFAASCILTIGSVCSKLKAYFFLTGIGRTELYPFKASYNL